jgi:hypothetical protein
VTKNYYSLILNTNSTTLLSPLKSYDISIKKKFTSDQDGNAHYSCYKLLSIEGVDSVSLLNEDEDNNILITSNMKNIMKNTIYLLSLLYNIQDSEEKYKNIDKKQLDILQQVFNVKSYDQLPILLNDGKHKPIFKKMTILFSASYDKSRQKRFKDYDNDTINIFESYNKKDKMQKFMNIFKESNHDDDDADSKFITLEKLKNRVIGFKYSLHIYFYRFDMVELHIRKRLSDQRKDVISEVNNKIGLYIFNNDQLRTIYFLIYSLIRQYKNKLNIIENDDVPEESLIEKPEKILLTYYHNKESIKLIPLIIKTIRYQFFYKPNGDENNELMINTKHNDNFIINELVPFIKDELINYVNRRMDKIFMSSYIINISELMYFLSTIFDFNKEEFEDNIYSIDKLKNLTIINNDNRFKNVNAYDLIENLLSCFIKSDFKVNDQYLKENTESNIKYKPLIGFIHSFKEYYNIEKKLFGLYSHTNFYINNFVYYNKKVPSTLLLTEKTLKYYYYPVKKQDILSNNDLLMLNDLIDNHFNQFTIIYQKSRFSFKRLEHYISTLILNKNKKSITSIDQDMKYLKEVFDEELFDPNNDYIKNEKNITNNEYDNYIKMIDNLKHIKDDRLQILIIIDCHLLSIHEWHNLLYWILTKKDKIKYVYFIGCPFLIPFDHKYGQPYLDALLTLSESETLNFLWDKENRQQNNKTIEKDDISFTDDDNLYLELDTKFNLMKCSFFNLNRYFKCQFQ